MNRYTFAILHNGREVENLDQGIFATEAEAEAGAADALDLCCPPGSPMRRFYRAEIRPARDAETTQTAKHTPGPWIVCEVEGDDSILNIEQDRHALVDEEPSIIGTVDMAGDGIDPKIGRANAHLIAAAPCLLAACEAVLRECYVSESDEGGDVAEMSADVLDIIRAAIAKARGKA